MLKRFRVNNFRNLVNVEFRPTGLNLLVGLNNAGKTNLCSAMRFLGLTAHFDLQKSLLFSLRETGNVTNAYVSDDTFLVEAEVLLKDDNDNDLRFIYILTVAVSRQLAGAAAPQPFRLMSEILRLTGGGFSDALLIENREGNVRLLHEKRYLGNAANDAFVETVAPTDTTMLMRLYDLETNKMANMFKQYLKNCAYYNLNTHSLRSPRVAIGQNAMSFDGSNLGKCLHFLHNRYPRIEGELIKAVQTLEPKLRYFTFFMPDLEAENVYWFIEDDAGRRFGVQSISDGTLLFLALALTIMIPKAISEADARKTDRVIIIEEPENGLHVGYLKRLLEMIDPSGQAGQFIITSHNPYFIDLFGEHLEGLFYMEPGIPSATLHQPDAVKINKLLEEMPLGELHFRELIR